MILCCKKCGGELHLEKNRCICNNCSKIYKIEDGIIILKESQKQEMGGQTLDLYKLRNERKLYNKYIKSNVEFCGRLHSSNFSNFHAKLLSPYFNNSIVIDLGCGQIPYINFFPDNQIKEYYGLDLDKTSLNIGQKNFKRKFPLILIQDDIRKVPFPSNSVDIIISSEVLEHLNDPRSYLKEMYKVCKVDGYLSLSTPCGSIYFHPHRIFSILRDPKKWWKKIKAHKYWNEVSDYHPALQPKALKKWVEEAGFSVVKHETRLWYYDAPPRLTWRFFLFLEKIGIPYSSKLFDFYLKFTDKLLSLNIPLIKWCGTRQFILCKKQ